MMRTVMAIIVFGIMASTAAAQTAAIEKGKQAYAAEKCQVCHSIGGVGTKKGPLDSVGAKLSADDIRQWIVSAPEMSAKTKSTRKPAMKAYANIAKEDLDALVVYLQSLKAK